MGSHIKKKIDALPNAHRIPKRWHNMKAQKDKRHPDTAWKQNPLKVVQEPTSVQVFKQLDKGLRHRMFKMLGSTKEFKPRKLVTYQPCISASAVLQFAENEKLASKKKAYILGTEDGPCVWNGNHRAVAALLTNRPFKAVFLDLTNGGRRD